MPPKQHIKSLPLHHEGKEHNTQTHPTKHAYFFNFTRVLRPFDTHHPDVELAYDLSFCVTPSFFCLLPIFILSFFHSFIFYSYLCARNNN